MQRRTVIKQMVYVAGGVLLIPSCMQDKSKASILLKKISIDGDQEKLMADLAETIIPATETPGAKDVSAHLFALMMVDDCYNEEDRKKFVQGLKAFETRTKDTYKKSFAECTPLEKEAILNELENKKTANPGLEYFYSTTKKLTIQAYCTSKYFLTKVHVYELVPGRYHGCVALVS